MKKQSPHPCVRDLADHVFSPKVQRSFPKPLTLNEEQTERESTPDDLNDRLPVDNGSLPNQREAPAATLLPPGANQDAVEEGSDGATPSGVTGENEIRLAPAGPTFTATGSPADEGRIPAAAPATPAPSSPRARLGWGSGTGQAALSPALQLRSQISPPTLLTKKNEDEDEGEEKVLTFKEQQEQKALADLQKRLWDGLSPIELLDMVIQSERECLQNTGSDDELEDNRVDDSFTLEPRDLENQFLGNTEDIPLKLDDPEIRILIVFV